MATTGLVQLGAQIPSVTKLVTQEKINQFEACGIIGESNIHTDPALAASRLGTSFPIASGRMSLAYGAESLRKFFGAEVFNHTGTINLKFLRPVKHGDTVTVTGHVTDTHQEENGTRVVVEVICQNQNGDKTAVGTATALVA